MKVEKWLVASLVSYNEWCYVTSLSQFLNFKCVLGYVLTGTPKSSGRNQPFSPGNGSHCGCEEYHTEAGLEVMETSEELSTSEELRQLKRQHHNLVADVSSLITHNTVSDIRSHTSNYTLKESNLQ